MGGFLGIGGSSSKTDRGNTLQGWSALKNIYNFAIPSGTEATGKATSYWENLMSGNRAARRGAVAPEINAVNATSDAQKRQLATSGTARGGGVNEASQKRSTDTMAQVDNLLFGVAPQAAKETGQLGTSTLATGTSAAGTVGGQSSGARASDNAINQDMVAKATMAILNIAGAF